MHPLHAVEAGLVHRPADVKDLIGHIPDAGGLTYQLLRDHANPRAEKMIVKACELITRHCGSGARRLPGTPPVWQIQWSSEDLVLVGHLYRDLNQPAKPDPQSPMLLFSRVTLIAAYGHPSRSSPTTSWPTAWPTPSSKTLPWRRKRHTKSEAPMTSLS